MDLQFVSLHKDGKIATIKINNPKALNALNTDILTELSAAFSDAESDESIYLIIITGEGRAFVAGANIEEMSGLDVERGEEFGKNGSDLFRRIESSEKPVIAAVNGFALGGGCELAMACDIRIAADTAKFGQPEVGLGITPGFGATVRLPQLVGVAKAKELIYTGKVIDAAEALSIGLVNQVVTPESLMDTVLEMANSIILKAPIAIKLSKKSINYSMDHTIDDSLAFEYKLFGTCFATDDQKEGMRAFLNREKPKFINK